MSLQTRRNTQTAPHLPSQQHGHLAENSSLLSFSAAHNNANNAKTAPASLGFGSTSDYEHSPDGVSSRFMSPAITPATNRQNQRLSYLLKMLVNSNGSGGSSGGGVGNGGILKRRDVITTEEEKDSRLLLVTQFDKNWTDLMLMIDYAKKLNDNEATKEELIPGVSDYNRGGGGGGMKIRTQKSSSKKSSTLPAIGSSQSQPATIGRKPIRAIVEDLQKRVHTLKTNPAQWEALQKRVEKYSQVGAGDASRLQQTNNQKDLIKRNKSIVGKLIPSVKKQKNFDLVERDKKRHLQVLATKKKLDATHLKTTLMAIKEKEQRLAQTLATEKDFIGSITTIQAKWFTIIFVALRVKRMKDYLDLKHQERKTFLKRQYSAVLIQRWYRGFLYAKHEIAIQNALLVIGYVFRKFYARWRTERQKKASATIQSFFKEVYDVSKLLKVVKKYRFSVIKAQKYVRSFLEIRASRVDVIVKLWDLHENTWWGQRQKGAKGMMDVKDKEKEKSVKKKKGKKDDLEKTTRIGEDLKRSVILENFIARRKIFWKAWISDSLKIGVAKEEASKKIPVFKLLPSKTELFEMMDHALISGNK